MAKTKQAWWVDLKGNTQVVCVSLDKSMRLLARAHSYRVQVAGEVKDFRRWTTGRGVPGWHDIQMIPRTHRREDIPCEIESAVSAFHRRVREWKGLRSKHGDLDVQRALNAVAHNNLRGYALIEHAKRYLDRHGMDMDKMRMHYEARAAVFNAGMKALGGVSVSLPRR